METQILLKLKYDNSGRIIWSQDQLDYIVKKYYETYSTPLIAKEFNTTRTSIRRALRKQGIKILSLSEIHHLRYPKDSNFFKEINTPQKAYWLGFLYADGNVSNDEISLALQISDESHIKKFQQAIGAINNKIQYPITHKNDKDFPQVKISFRDEQMAKDLADKGCVPNKTLKLNFPYDKIPKELYSHFIRGVMDGDGNLGWDNYNLKTNFRIGFTGTKELLEGIKEILKKPELKMENRGKVFYFSINGNKQLLNILAFIYKNSYDEIELTRKREKYNEFLEYMENKNYGN